VGKQKFALGVAPSVPGITSVSKFLQKQALVTGIICSGCFEHLTVKKYVGSRLLLRFRRVEMSAARNIFLADDYLQITRNRYFNGF
jgi:hypothetical protein